MKPGVRLFQEGFLIAKPIYKALTLEFRKMIECGEKGLLKACGLGGEWPKEGQGRAFVCIAPA
jgi:hypothetical protein